jgi:cation:H+ antiporter
MSLWLAIFLFFIALVLILKGADWFVGTAAEMAEGFHVSKVLIGATLVSFATVAPEFFVSVIAAAMGKVEMAVGNAVGSPVANIGLILGCCVCFTFMPVSREMLKRECVMMLTAVVLLFLFSFNKVITRPISLFFLFLVCIYVRYSLRQAGNVRKKWRKEGVIPKTDFNPKRELLFFSVGAIMVIGGSRLLILSGTTIAMYFGISEGIIGLTLVAFGTSLPELFTSVVAVTKGHKEISVGNIIGANILDIILVLGVSGLIRPLPIDRNIQFFATPILLLLSVLLIIFGRTRRGFQRWEGGILVAVYSLYIFYLFL